jgi:microcystin-dependent protein
MGALTDGQFVDNLDLNPITFDTGDVRWSALRSAASGWLKCDGSAVSRTTYAALFAAIVPALGATTVTIASPAVFTLASHGLAIGDCVYLTTTGALPTGLSANTIYYVVSTPTTDTFTLSATEGGAAINTSGAQSGTHTLRFCPYGLGDGSTTFNLPIAPFSGRISSAGAIVRGAGFTCSKTGTGVYAITFTAAYLRVPFVQVTGEGAAQAAETTWMVAPATTGVTIRSFSTASSAIDDSFTFGVNGGGIGNGNLFIKV